MEYYNTYALGVKNNTLKQYFKIVRYSNERPLWNSNVVSCITRTIQQQNDKWWNDIKAVDCFYKTCLV